MQLGVDFSQGKDLSQGTIDCWETQGATFAIVQYSAALPAYLAVLDNQGLDVDVYVYLYFPRSLWKQTPEDRVSAAIRMCQGHQVGTVWNDAEEPTDAQGPANWQANIDAMWLCINAEWAAGYQAGIYTNIYRYRERFGDYTGFAERGVKLWNADYLAEGLTADLTAAPIELELRHGSYGGWTKPDVWQWHNTTMFCGHSVDLNVRESLEDSDMLIPHNAKADWFEDRNIEAGEGYVMQVRSDLQLPPEAKMVRLDVYLGSGGPFVVRHPSGLVAGVVEIGEGHGLIDVEVGEDGTCGFEAPAPVHLRRIGALGYWK